MIRGLSLLGPYYIATKKNLGWETEVSLANDDVLLVIAIPSLSIVCLQALTAVHSSSGDSTAPSQRCSFWSDFKFLHFVLQLHVQFSESTELIWWNRKQEKVKMIKKEEPPVTVKSPESLPLYWYETSDSVSRRFHFESDGHLSVNLSLSLSLSP